MNVPSPAWLAPVEVEADPELDELDRLAEARSALFAPMNAGLEAAEPAVGPPRRVGTDRHAYDLREVWRRAGKDPSELQAGLLGPKVPLLIAHTLSLLPVDGEDPGKVAKFGYEVELRGVEATVVAAFPTKQLLEVARIEQKVRFALNSGGEVSAAPPVLGAVNLIPGVNVAGAQIEASTDQSASLFLSYAVTLPRLLGGRDGLKTTWQFTRQDELLEGEHVVYTSIRVPRGTKELRFVYRTWARVPRPFSWFTGDALYRTPETEHVLRLGRT